MLNNEILIKRLAHIKQLYTIGIEQSNQPESIAVFSLLAFHDSIEMFLKLLAEHKGINSAKYSFMDYWVNISNLTLKESMRSLNNRRVNLKHKGLIPAKSEIEISRVNTTDFFDQNTKVHFGIDFNDISPIELVSFSSVKEYLKTAQDALNSEDGAKSIEYTAYAFEELLHAYESNKSYWGYSPFFFGEDMTFMSSFMMGLSNYDSPREFKELSSFVDKVSESIKQLQKAVKITSFGIDYKEYVKFMILTPIVSRTVGGDVVAEMMGKRKWTKINCQYCIDFVIKASLKLQEFDFDIETLDETEFKIEIIEKE